MPNRTHLAVQVEPEGLRIVRAEDSYVWDDHRRRYIDFIMGWCVGNLGWALPEITEAIARARHPDYVYPHFDYRGWNELADLLTSIAPPGLTRCYRATGGSEAVDIAVQIAQTVTGRSKVVGIAGAYHGNTIGTRAIRKRVPPPLDETTLDRVETLLKKRDVAAFIMEPISINLGVLVPESAFMTGLQRLCRRYGALLIMDEVACGFGRTGNLFATEHYDVAPDMMVLAKSLSGGYGGIGALLVTEKVHRAVQGEFEAYSSYGWHPLAVTAASANVRYWKRHQDWLLTNCIEIGAYIERRLSDMFGHRGEVRAKGLAICVRLDDESRASRIVAGCRKNRLLVTSAGEDLQILPAINVERRIAERAMDILEKSL